MNKEMLYEAYMQSDALVTGIEITSGNVSVVRMHIYECVDLFKLPEGLPGWVYRFIQEFRVYDQLIEDMQRDIERLAAVHDGKGVAGI